jgi:hypothetical protein
MQKFCVNISSSPVNCLLLHNEFLVAAPWSVAALAGEPQSCLILLQTIYAVKFTQTRASSGLTAKNNP